MMSIFKAADEPSKRKIFKYPIEIGEFSHTMHEGATILFAQVQNGKPFLWASTPTYQRQENRHFQIIGTGYEYDPKGKEYITTFQQGPLVWHLFEIKE